MLRSELSSASSGLVSVLSSLGLLSLLGTSASFWGQIPPLITAVAGGTESFTPSPRAVLRCARARYRTRRTLLVQFEDDDTDESPRLEEALRGAAEDRNRDRGRGEGEQEGEGEREGEGGGGGGGDGEMTVRRVLLRGNHLTPVVGVKADRLEGEGEGKKRKRELPVFRDVINLVDEIEAFLVEAGL